MAILNYTTKITAEKTAGEIQQVLARHGASSVLLDYAGGQVSAISFRIFVPQHGQIAFRLPSNTDGVLNAMKRDRKIPAGLKNKDQAARVGWRIVKDWVEAQLAIVEAGVATTAQVFLPYAQGPGGTTVYERFVDNGIGLIEHKGERNGS